MSNFAPKQKEVLACIKKENPKILIVSGAKRAGKTFVLGLGFLGKVSCFKGKTFIIGGATLAAIQRNILNDWESLLGVTFKFYKDGHFNLFDNKIYCFGGDNSASWKAVRGFTSQGALINEATALHDSFIKEVVSRCSEEGSFVYMDTNPENPLHTVKVDYIDKSGQRLSTGKLNIQAFHFTLDDNTNINSEYIESIKASTPTGVIYDRDILGKWVNSQGLIYKDFNTKLILTNLEEQDYLNVWCGVDWGYSHKGSITVLATTKDKKIIVLEEVVAQYKEIDWWVDKAISIKNKYKDYGNLNFYCDSARPEHVARFQREKIKAFNGNKKVAAGIEVVSKLIKTERLLIASSCKNMLKEFGLYAWNDKTDEPIKTNDDSLDSLRYAIYSYYILNTKFFGF